MSKPWKRLGPWLPGGDPTDDGAAALRALADVTDVRRSLEQAEVAAVRTARRHGRSWTEIAAMSAMTRQSAWERWHELDDPPATAATMRRNIAALADEVSGQHDVAVPDVVGLSAADALGILTRAGFDVVSATPDIGLPERPDDSRPAVVVRQYPEPGTRIRPTSTVRLWLRRGDGDAGVREPRRPVPPPRAAVAERDERMEDAVG